MTQHRLIQEVAQEHSLEHIANCSEYSAKTLDALRREVACIVRSSGCASDALLICGSYARKEASSLSDVDYFLVADRDEGDRTHESLLRAIVQKVDEMNLKNPSKGGPKERQDSIFREIKNEGYQFTRELLKLFETTFHSTHPIRRAIVY